MGSDLKIFRITDYAVAFHILRHPAIVKAITEEGMEPITPNLLGEYWMGASRGNDICGCFRIQKMGRTIYQIHTFFIPGFRKYADDAGDMVSLWAIDNIPEFESFCCMVPVCFKNVLEHVIRKGFKRCGKLPNAYSVDGKLIDIFIFSVDKHEIKRLINGRL